MAGKSRVIFCRCAPRIPNPSTWWPCLRGEMATVLKGPDENSPVFQRREPDRKPASPVGTAERVPQNRLQPSLRDVPRIESEPGVETPGYCRLPLRDNAPASDRKSTR